MKTKADWNAFSEELQRAIDAVAALHSLKATRARLTYADDHARIRIEFSEPGAVDAMAMRDWDALRAAYGLETMPFGAEFGVNGLRFSIAGVRPRASKMPIVGQQIGATKRWVFSAETIQRAWSREQATAKGGGR